MLLSPGHADEKILRLMRSSDTLRGSADEIAEKIACANRETEHALEDMVARNMLRRHEVPGRGYVYWN